MARECKSTIGAVGLGFVGFALLSAIAGSLNFIGSLGRSHGVRGARSPVAMKSLRPPEITLPFMDEPIEGSVFALYVIGAAFVVALFLAYQLWRLFFSKELGTYAEIKWGGARPPKEYVEEMKRLEARRKKKFLRSITDGT
eukprot:g15413.t1